MSAVKEDCVLEDDMGTAILHIWDPLVREVTNGTSYNFQNLTIKHFKGTTFLSTSLTTSITKMEQIKLQNPRPVDKPFLKTLTRISKSNNSNLLSKQASLLLVKHVKEKSMTFPKTQSSANTVEYAKEKKLAKKMQLFNCQLMIPKLDGLLHSLG